MFPIFILYDPLKKSIFVCDIVPDKWVDDFLYVLVHM